MKMPAIGGHTAGVATRQSFRDSQFLAPGDLVGTVLALSHVAFEDLGSFGPVLEGRGHTLLYRAAPAGLDNLDVLGPDLLVVLGGPIGVYEQEAYPFLRTEIAAVERRLTAGRPTLGLCLGSQIMARALGARVYPGEAKEIGWSPLTLTEAGRRSCLAPLDPDIAVLHWHGDTFDLPEGAVRLASTALYENQAFAWGKAAFALQFHPEATAEALEHWFVGHAAELAQAGLNVPELRNETARRAPALRERARACLEAWLDPLGL